MRKVEELSNPLSCLNRAKDDELVFVLLGRDVAAPDAIRAWAGARVALGKNVSSDPQIVEALACAKVMAADDETEIRPPVPAGFLEVGRNPATREVIVNHPRLDVDENGCGYLVFSPAEAREFAGKLIGHADLAEVGK